MFLFGLDQPAPIVSFVPLFMFALVFGLSMSLLGHANWWFPGRRSVRPRTRSAPSNPSGEGQAGIA